MLSEQREKMIQRLRKMLALAENNPNENEAAMAAERAHKLMLEHNLKFGDISERPVGFDGYLQADLSIELGKRQPKELAYIAAILDKHFMVKCVIEKTQSKADGLRARSEGVKLNLYGRRANAEIAQHFYLFLARTFRELFRQMVARATEGQKGFAKKFERYREPYYEGLTLGIDQLLEAQAKNHRKEHGLVPVDVELNRLFDEAEIPEQKQKERERKQSDLNALTLGYGDARKVQLNKPLARTGQNQIGEAQ